MIDNRRLLIGSIIALAGVVLACLIGASFFTYPPGRTAYRPYNFDSDPWLTTFTQEYHTAQTQGAPWLATPEAVAFHLARYPNEYRRVPEHVQVITDTTSIVTVITTEDKLMDDSVGAQEVRVDLVKQGFIWKIVWAGARYRCRDDILPGWTTGLCS